MTGNNNTLAEQFALALGKINACSEAREWADGLGYDTAWNTCQNPGWMFFLIYKITPLTPIQNELLICRFAREVVHLADDPRVLACIETREAWIRGEVSDEVRNDAIDAVWNARYAGAAAGYAGWAAAGYVELRAVAESVAESAARAAARDVAWSAARAAARAAAWSAARGAARAAARDAWAAARSAARSVAIAAAGAAARDAASAIQCDIIRELVPRPLLRK